MAGGRFALEVQIEQVEAPATLWFATAGSKIALGPCSIGSTRLTRDSSSAQTWWRLELRAGSGENGDVLTLTNPVYVAGAEGSAF
jgi:hypothetical protein